MRALTFTCIVLTLVIPLMGVTITVDDDGPADFHNIQAAIDDANDGDEIIVADGTYTSDERGFDFHGKAIIVRSENGPESCVIDGQDLTRGFYFHNGEDANSVLDGFTITRGGHEFGGGIRCVGSSPTIRNCIISNNRALGGGGIHCTEGSPTISNCIISNNSAGSAGGIGCLDSSPVIANCIITGNWTTAWSRRGGGIECFRGNPIIINCAISGNFSGSGGGINCQYAKATITNCTVTSNLANSGGGITLMRSNAAVTNCILWDNLAEKGSEITVVGIESHPCTLALSYTDLQGGQDNVYVGSWSTLNWGPGNIDADPCFVTWGYWDHNGTPDYIWDDFWVRGDYHLLANSPCIDTGDPNYVAGPDETDLDGNPRVIDGDEDGTAVVDMGAYEYVPLPPVEAEMKLMPHTLNCASRGKYVKARILLPEGFQPEDVDVSTPAVAEPMDVESEYIKILGGDTGPVKLEIAFDRRAFCDELAEPGQIEITVTGLLNTGQYFYATDTITIKKSETTRKPIKQAQPARRLRLFK